MVLTTSTPSSDVPVDVLDTPITDVIRQSDGSVRLNNALKGGRNKLPFYNVREYLEAGPTAKDRFLIIPNLGRRSADELDNLVRVFVANGPSQRSQPVFHQGPNLNDVRQELVGMFSGFRFPDVFLQEVVSTRLANALRNNPQLAGSLSKFLDEPERICCNLRSAGNVGRVSISELMDLAKEFTAEVLRRAGFSEDVIPVAHAVIFDRRIASDEALAHLEALLKNSRPVLGEGEPSSYSAHEVVSQIMSELAERDRAVLERRYGFLTGKIETLEEIALDYRLTRERIRQIEAKNLRRIGRSKLGRRLRLSFHQEIGARLMAATDNLGFIKDGEKSQFVRRLAVADQFAIDVLYEDRDKFLREFARRWHGGWILPPFVKEELQELLREVKGRLASICLPAAFSELVAGLPERSVRTAIELGTDLSIVEGYLIAGRVRARPLRTIRLHRCLVDAASVLEVSDLIARYGQTTPDDKDGSVRNAMLVMLTAPHLFLGILDRHWYGLGQSGVASEAPETRDDVAAPSAEDDAAPARLDEEGIRAVLRQILLEQGPLRFVDLRDRATRRLRDKSPHSVGPTLLTSGEFVRPLPGIYAVPEQIPSAAAILFDPPSFLLTEEQARYLAEARYAGEPFGRYPMWIPEAEYALCRWSQTNCDPFLFQSLLAVASMDLWPVSAEERDHWFALKRTHFRYRLAAPQRYPIRQLWPPLDRLLAACIFARQNNGLSWISANRILKRQVDAHVSPGLLALMVSLGALEAPSQWQMFHKAGHKLTAIIQSLSLCLHKQGALEWNSSAAGQLIQELVAARQATKSGWVDADVVEDLITASAEWAVASLPTAVEADESTSSFEDLLRDVAESRKAEFAHQTMRSVLARQD
jgi:hypothetical protein